MSDSAANTTAPAAPAAPAPPPFVPKSLPVTLAYMGASLIIGLTQGMAQGFISSNTSQIAGDLGVTTTQATWLMVAFMVPRASMPILLIKLRTQYGLRRFAEWAIVAYLIVAVAALGISDLRSALVLQFLAGVVSAPLSSLAFLYMIEPLAPQWKTRLGLPIAMAAISAGTSLARVVSPELMVDTGWWPLHVLTLGMAGIALGLVYLLPLTSPPRMKVIAVMDIVSWLLIAVAFGGITVVFITGATYWWTSVNWLGWVLVVAIIALTLAAVIELHRKSPLLDLRWLTTPAMVHLSVTLLLFRLMLSEQSSGAPRMFQQLGVIQDQLVPLFSVIVLAGFVGAFAVIPFMKLERVPQCHLIALVLIAIGAWMDSQSTIDTRPAQMMVSQGLIAFAATLFMAPAMLRGLMAAMAKGSNYILSFIIVFLSTQSLGGAVGSGLFSTFINRREALHLQMLREQLTTVDPLVLQHIAQRAAALTSQISDGGARRAQAVALLAQDATSQAYVMAYNDAYFLISIVAMGAASILTLHIFRDWLAARMARPVPPVVEPA